MHEQWLLAYISLLSPVATLAIVMVGFLYNNARMNDMRDMLRAEMAKNQTELLMKFAELESRLSRLERFR
jgi:hypothetical protein